VGSNPTGPTIEKGPPKVCANDRRRSYTILALNLARPLQQTTVTTEQIREFVIAGHGNLDRVQQMLAEFPELINASYQWNENDTETTIQAAAQVGSVPIAEYLLAHGAPLEVCTAAMLGREAEVKHRLDDDPREVNAVGAHGIPLLPHAVWSGNLELVQLVFARGATTGANLALHNSVTKGNPEVTKWILENAKPDVNSKNFQGKTPLSAARDRKNEKIIQILVKHGAVE